MTQEFTFSSHEELKQKMAEFVKAHPNAVFDQDIIDRQSLIAMRLENDPASIGPPFAGYSVKFILDYTLPPV